MTIYMFIATIAWFSLAYGYLRRYDRNSHILFMLTGITLDILLVVYLQCTRNAIATAVGFSLKPLQQVHILFSTLALLCYFPTLYFGFRLILENGNQTVRNRHVFISTAALIFRTMGFFFMFSMLNR